MAEQEFYRLDLVVGTTGTEKVKNELRATDRFIEQTRKRGEMLNRMKMNPAVRVEDRATRTLRTIQSGLNRLGGTVHKVTVIAVDKTKSVFGNIASRAASIANPFTLSKVIAGSVATYAGVLSPLKLAGEAEQANIAFETMLGSQEKAQQFLGDLTKFANKTPFELPQLRDASKRMLAFGFASESIIPTLTALGNAAAGLGVGSEGINRITLALGQMRAKSKVSAEEMMQLTEIGIPAWDILAKKMNVSTAQVMKLSEKGLIPANKAIDALVEGMNDRFPNMMNKQSKSLFGFWSTIKDTFNNNIVKKWGDGLAQTLKPRFDKLTTWIDNNGDTIERWGQTLQRVANQGSDWIVKKFEGAFSYLKTNFFDNPDFQKLDFGGKIKFVFNKLTDGFRGWLDTGGQDIISDFSNRFVKGLAEAIKASTELIIEVLTPIASAVLKGALNGLIESFGSESPDKKIEKTYESIKKIEATKPGETFLKGPTQLIATQEDDSLAGRFWKWIKDKFDNPTPHALGGILTRPHLGMVAEAGPEAIIPLSSRLRNRSLSLWQQTGEYLGVQSGPVIASGGGGINIQIGDTHVNIDSSELDEEALTWRIGSVIVGKIMKSLENRT